MEGKDRGKRLVQYVPDYVVFDLETTGFRAGRDRIIEISAVRAEGGKVAATFSTLVNPGCGIPAPATAVNGITDGMVADAPDIGTVLPEFLHFVGEGILVGHNIHSFDMNFLYEAAGQLGEAVGNDYIDTLYMARQCLPQLRNHKLADVAAYFHISSEGAHRALNDCMINQKCYEELAKLQGNIKVALCPRCGGELVRRKGRFGEFFGCSNYPSCRFTRNINEFWKNIKRFLRFLCFFILSVL